MLEQQCSIFVSITFFSLGILFGLVLQIIAFIVNLKTTNQNLIIYVIFFFFCPWIFSLRNILSGAYPAYSFKISFGYQEVKMGIRLVC